MLRVQYRRRLMHHRTLYFPQAYARRCSRAWLMRNAEDAAAHKVVFVTKGRDAGTIGAFSQFLSEHKGAPEQIACVSIDMSPAFIKGVTKHLPNARITFDKFHVVAHASKALDETRRSEQKTDPSLKGLRWALLKDRGRLPESQRADLSMRSWRRPPPSAPPAPGSTANSSATSSTASRSTLRPPRLGAGAQM